MPEKLTRTHFRDPTQAGEPPRTASVRDEEALVDFEQYTAPLARAQLSALTGSGVAAGFDVRAGRGTPDVRVLAGVAVTDAGNLVVLSPDGQAKLAQPRDLVAVTASGAVVPTAGLDGVFVLTVTFDETFDRALWLSSDKRVFQRDHTPWLRLQPTQPAFTAGQDEVVLAEVTVAGGTVTAVTPGARGRAGTVRVHRASVTGDVDQLVVRDEPAGGLSARSDGSLEVTASAVRLPPTVSIGGASVESAAGGRSALSVVPGLTVGASVPGAPPGPGATLSVTPGCSVLDGAAAVEGPALAVGSPARGPQWSLAIDGPTGDWYLRSASTAGKVVLQDGGGNVGIGTADPHVRLHVSGGAIRPAAGLDQDAGISFAPAGQGDVGGYLRYGQRHPHPMAGQLSIGVTNENDTLVVEHAGTAVLQVSRDEVQVSRTLTVSDLAVNTASVTAATVSSLQVSGVLTANGGVRASDADVRGRLTATSLSVGGDVGLAGNSGWVTVGGDRPGKLLALGSALYFSDPRDGTIQILHEGNDLDWGTMVGHFNQPSSARFKEEVEALDAGRLGEVFDDVVRLPVTTFRYRGSAASARRTLGVILEDCPTYLADGSGINPVEYTAAVHAAVKVLADRVADLSAQLRAQQFARPSRMPESEE